jgi:aromatic-L-amino-acid/L-tryptophan decarboxylase
MEKKRALRYRIAPLEMTPSEFRKAGYRLIDQVAELLCTLPERPVAPNESPATLRALLGSHSLPEQGRDASTLLDEATNLLFDHSVFNGHPRFMGFITSSAAPIGALGELLAAAVNPNVGSSLLAPIASEIEAQVVHWIAEMIGYPRDCPFATILRHSHDPPATPLWYSYLWIIIYRAETTIMREEIFL